MVITDEKVQEYVTKFDMRTGKAKNMLELPERNMGILEKGDIVHVIKDLHQNLLYQGYGGVPMVGFEIREDGTMLMCNYTSDGEFCMIPEVDVNNPMINYFLSQYKDGYMFLMMIEEYGMLRPVFGYLI